MAIDWREMALDAGILRETAFDQSRLIVWVPAESDGDFQYWERIGNLARGEVVVDHGLCSTPAATIRARRRIKGLLGKLLGRFGAGRGKNTFLLPSGESVEQCGERATDRLLVWTEDPAGSLDEG